MPVQIFKSELSGSRLVEDYLSGIPAATGLLGGSPFRFRRFQQRVGHLNDRFTAADRTRIARMLQPAGRAGAEKLDRFVREGGVVVTTGQQAGLFGGPAYTLYKALTAIALAEHLEGAFAIPVLPVFWIASEDHDWAEVNHTFVVDAAGSLKKISIRGDDRTGAPVAERVLTDDVEIALDKLATSLQNKGCIDANVKLVRDVYLPGRGMADAFRELLHQVFAGSALLTVDAAETALKQASIPVLVREIERARAGEAGLRERSERLFHAGYHEQVSLIDSSANLFVHSGGGRHRLVRNGDGWKSAAGRWQADERELLRQVQAEPGMFSPNALLRPVVENALFPVAAYVGGPGEIAYFAQLEPLFAVHGLEPPIVFPRLAATLVDEPAAELMEQLGLSLAELGEPLHVLEQVLLKRAVADRVAAAVQQLRTATVAHYDALIAAVPGSDPALRRSLGSLRNRALLLARDAERKVLRDGRRHGGEVPAVGRLRTALKPLGLPQDRVLNGIWLLGGERERLLHELKAVALPAQLFQSAAGGVPGAAAPVPTAG